MYKILITYSLEYDILKMYLFHIKCAFNCLYITYVYPRLSLHITRGVCDFINPDIDGVEGECLF